MRIRIIRAAARDFRPLSAEEASAWLEPWKSIARPGTELDCVRVVRGAETIESIYDEEMAAPFILNEVERAERECADAAIIHCMADPALEAARELAGIPVLGEGLACFLTALSVGRMFSIIASGPPSIPLFERNVRSYGLSGHLASVRSLDISVSKLRVDLAALEAALLVQARQAIEVDHADVIIPGCGEIYGMSTELTRRLGVPVLDPIAVVLGFAELAVHLSLTGSKVAYPFPPAKRREV